MHTYKPKMSAVSHNSVIVCTVYQDWYKDKCIHMYVYKTLEGFIRACVEELCVYASVLAKIINGLKLKRPLSKWERHRWGVFPYRKSFAYNTCTSLVWERMWRSACRQLCVCLCYECGEKSLVHMHVHAYTLRANS